MNLPQKQGLLKISSIMFTIIHLMAYFNIIITAQSILNEPISSYLNLIMIFVYLGLFLAIQSQWEISLFFAWFAFGSEIILSILSPIAMNEISAGMLLQAIFVSGICTIMILVAISISPRELSYGAYSINWKNGSSEYAIELRNVVKDYVLGPVVVHAVRGIDLKVRHGEFIAIMGPSGSGKSTLLNLIGALDRPTSGKVIIDGVDISKLDDTGLAYLRNKKIGFIFQTFNLINRTSVLRNVELPSIVAGVPKKERIRRAKEMLKIVGLVEEIHRQPKYLSGGQQQRVAIARALMNYPAIILADEPTGNLDSKTGQEIVDFLRKLNTEFGTTIVVVTHDRSVAEQADKIIHIKDGKLFGEEIIRSEKYERK